MYYSKVTKYFVLFLVLEFFVEQAKCDDLFLSNNLCLSYIGNNRISPSQSVGECVIICKIVNGQKACATRDLSCMAYASYIYHSPQAQNGNFYCNVLPYASEGINSQTSPDQERVCSAYKNSLPYSSRESFCRLTCGYLYVVTSPQSNAYEKKFMCDSQSNFVGCQGFKFYIQSASTQPGSFSCEIYNHGDNYNYNRVAPGSENGAYEFTFPSFTGFFTSGVQSVVNTGSQISQGFSQGILSGVNRFSDIFRSPFQFGTRFG